jgi:HAD superfamily hydrolase (TIGR01484 family)
MAKVKPSFLLCFDFDGTLVLPEADPIFHPGLGQMIRQLRLQGAAWVVNTGRSLPQTLQGLAQYGLFMEPDYLIVRECDIYRPGLFSRWKDFGPWNKNARRAHQRFVKQHATFFDATRRFLEQHTEAQLLHGDDGDLGIIASHNEEMDRICTWIDEQRTHQPDIGYQRNTIYLRFAHAAYSKGSALGELTKRLNLRADHVFAAGDNYNDLSMLHPQFAHKTACPSNALAPIKSHVRSHGGFVAERPASEGMMEALAHYFSSKSA